MFKIIQFGDRRAHRDCLYQCENLTPSNKNVRQIVPLDRPHIVCGVQRTFVPKSHQVEERLGGMS